MSVCINEIKKRKQETRKNSSRQRTHLMPMPFIIFWSELHTQTHTVNYRARWWHKRTVKRKCSILSKLYCSVLVSGTYKHKQKNEKWWHRKNKFLKVRQREKNIFLNVKFSMIFGSMFRFFGNSLSSQHNIESCLVRVR